MRNLATGVFILSIMVPLPADSKVDPLRVITEQLTRPEIMLVIDTSGSMSWQTSGSGSGIDCGGSRNGTVDLCGDGVCHGQEGGSCATDCNITDNVATPGSAPPCAATTNNPIRMFITKRVLQSVLPDLRSSASFGLATFYQDNYYRYYTSTATSTKLVSVFLTQFELEHLGAWSSGPVDSFTPVSNSNHTWNGSKWADGTDAYQLLSTSRVQSDSSITIDDDSLYKCSVDPALEAREKFSVGGMSYGSCTSGTKTGLYQYRGSFYAYEQKSIDAAVEHSETQYRGPQYEDAGTVYVHRKMNAGYTAQGLGFGSDGAVLEPLNQTLSQSNLSNTAFRIMTRLNHANNGGLIGRGGTPTGPAMETAQQHFIHRNDGDCSDTSVDTITYPGGSCPFTAADPAAACRPRFALLLTDGMNNSGVVPWTVSEDLYKQYPSNPIKTLVVALPGLPSTEVARLDAIADAGDNGVWDTSYASGAVYPVDTAYTPSKTAFVATNEAELVTAITDALYEMIKGDYTTAAASTTTSGTTSTITNDWALIPSTEFPGWYGHLRAVDLTQVTLPVLWDAGTKLDAKTYSTRKMYTGYSTSNGGTPVPLMDSTGNANVNGGCAGCGSVGVKSVWQVINPTITDAEITATIDWLSGKTRLTNRLGPILRCQPQVVGRPPRYYAGDHPAFETAHANRETLIYVTSNDGVLHAFRSAADADGGGEEVFAYVGPSLLDKINSLRKAGGQSPDPTKFEWLMAGFPRVEDIPGTTDWKTQLVLGLGPENEAFFVLDISDPSDCSSTPCALNDPPFEIVSESRQLSVGSVMGENWSSPIFFYTKQGANLVGHAASGSGYGTGTEGHNYNYFDTLWNTPTNPGTNPHLMGSPLVDYGLISSTVAAINLDDNRKVIATYQVDLQGRIVRYEEGDVATSDVILTAGETSPFYYHPAIGHLGSNQVALAAISDSQDEASPNSSTTTTMHFLLETGGTPDYTFNCDVQDICSCFSSYRGTCAGAPSSDAKPVGAPLLVMNDDGSGVPQAEAFFVVYDPPTTACGSGTSWLIRVSKQSSGMKLESVKSYANQRATGIGIAGGGVEVLVTMAGKGGAAASVKPMNNAISGGTVSPSNAMIELWREVK